MPSTTVLRVKRRRDEPAPPETFQLQTDGISGMSRSKRARKHDDAQVHSLSGLLQDKASLAPRPETIKEDGGHEEANSSSSNQTDANGNVAFDSSVGKPGKQILSKRAIVFKKVSTSDLESQVVSKNSLSASRKNKRKADSEQYNGAMGSVQNRVNVVEATLDSLNLPCSSDGIHTDGKIGTKSEHSDSKSALDDNIERGGRLKRSRVELKLIESRTMTESEFWKRQKEQDQGTSPAYNSPADNPWMSMTCPNSPSPLKLGKSDYRDRMRRIAVGSRKTPKNRKSPSKVLHPLAQRIETSLVSLQSDPSLSNLSKHISLLDTNTSSSAEFSIWLNYQSNSLGTILHVLALGNGVDAIKHLLTERGEYLEWKKDDDGRTPLDIAEMISAMGVVDCFKGWDKYISREEEDDYVYDVYYLDQGEAESDEIGNGCLDNVNGERSSSRGEGDGLELRQEPQIRLCTGATNDEDHDTAPQDRSKKESVGREEPLIVMRGGVGYWNDEGELILEAASDEDMDDSDCDDEEYDSNCESFEGNDYPDADSSVEEGVNRYYSSYGLDEDYEGFMAASSGFGLSTQSEQTNGFNLDLLI